MLWGSLGASDSSVLCYLGASDSSVLCYPQRHGIAASSHGIALPSEMSKMGKRWHEEPPAWALSGKHWRAMCRHMKEAQNAFDTDHPLHTFSIGIAGSPDLAAAARWALFHPRSLRALRE